MNTIAPTPVSPRRHVGRWILLGLGLFMIPVLFAGIAFASMFRLDGNATTLRREVMASTDTNWNTKVQLSVGSLTLGAVRTGLRFVEHKNIADARLALSAVRHASVGVYECKARGEFSAAELLARTDAKMEKRGWSRLVSVVDRDETVLIYTTKDFDMSDRLELCLAVVSGRELVVVSTKVNAEALAELVSRHTPHDKLRGKFAKLSF